TEKPSSQFSSKNMPHANIDLPKRDFDLTTAAAQLVEAGWTQNDKGEVRDKDGQKLELTLSYDNHSNSQNKAVDLFEVRAKEIVRHLNILAQLSTIIEAT
ncbi:nickel ABC transporter, nickel/metallophore periplasmic binding protein, partial [Staphylococcus pseudintermedius]